MADCFEVAAVKVKVSGIGEKELRKRSAKVRGWQGMVINLPASELVNSERSFSAPTRLMVDGEYLLPDAPGQGIALLLS